MLSNLVDFINPELVVLGGGLTDALPDIVRSEVEAGIYDHVTEDAKQGLRVVTSALKGRAVAAGAAKIAADFRSDRKTSRAA